MSIKRCGAKGENSIKLVLIGSEGNVGKGIKNAIQKEKWDLVSIDPQINQKFEEIAPKKLKVVFGDVHHAVYAADLGNRDDYDLGHKLARSNNIRFNYFCQKLRELSPLTTIWYIGGSWTKRNPSNRWHVDDHSPNKSMSHSNAYEKAKISAEKNALRWSKEMKIRFLDWSSVVPNLSPNFSISKMVREGVVDGIISYSPKPFGRPLLDSTQAGEALVLLMKHDDNINFHKHLIPGVFIYFEEFAKLTQHKLQTKTRRKIILKKLDSTPDFLRTTVSSQQLAKLGFVPNRARVLQSLAVNIDELLAKI